MVLYPNYRSQESEKDVCFLQISIQTGKMFRKCLPNPIILIILRVEDVR